MADLPIATARLVEGGGGVASGTDLLCVMSCASTGTDNSPRLVTAVQDYLDDKGLCEGVAFAVDYVDVTRLPILEIKLETAVAGSVGPVDTSHITGTSVITFTGTPFDRDHIKLLVKTGGTIGTDGIELWYSLDGGRVYSRLIRLGTATSFAIPSTGITANFAAGTLVAGDYATAHTIPPMWDADSLTAAFAALLAQSLQPRLILICGDVTSDDELQDIIDAIESYEAANRDSRVICQLRSRHPDVAMQGKPTDVDFDATTDTITRNTGSWVTDGFKAGMTIRPVGVAAGANNGTSHVVTTVSATVLTVGSSPGLATVANVNGATISITGTETPATWRAALGTDIVGNSALTEKVSARVNVRAGRGRRGTKLNKFRKQRPAAWHDATMMMSHDLHISSAEVGRCRLPGVTITDENGNLEDHDERVDGGLLALRIGCLRTHDEVPGVFIALPLTLAEDDAEFSRAPVGFVGDRICRIIRRVTTLKLNSNVVLVTAEGPTRGFITPAEKKRIEEEVLSAVRAEMMTPGPEGQRISGVTFTMSGNVDLRVTGADVPCECVFDRNGYLEKISTTVRASRAGA